MTVKLDAANLKPTTLTVTPIPASESRTLRLTKLTAIWSVVVAVAPDILQVLGYLILNDPTFSETIARWFPPQIRYPVMAIILALAGKHYQLRKDTNAPIIGTPAATPPTPPVGAEKVGE